MLRVVFPFDCLSLIDRMWLVVPNNNNKCFGFKQPTESHVSIYHVIGRRHMSIVKFHWSLPCNVFRPELQ